MTDILIFLPDLIFRNYINISATDQEPYAYAYRLETYNAANNLLDLCLEIPIRTTSLANPLDLSSRTLLAHWHSAIKLWRARYTIT